jgi:hypothetical protein
MTDNLLFFKHYLESHEDTVTILVSPATMAATSVQMQKVGLISEMHRTTDGNPYLFLSPKVMLEVCVNVLDGYMIAIDEDHGVDAPAQPLEYATL